MKLKFCIIVFFTISFGCQNNLQLNGSYSICINGEYTEVYFKQDSMRIASENVWVKLSQWRKVRIKNDTLYFETFGEWRKNLRVKIKYAGINKTELHFLETDDILNLERINVKLNFKDSLKFWNGFKNRLNHKTCK